MKHTALPWVAEGRLILAGPRNAVAKAHDRADHFDREGQANAEFIVKACNNHYALKAALEGALDSLEYQARVYPEASGWGVRDCRIRDCKLALENLNGP